MTPFGDGERAPNGRFLPGHAGGPGNPHAGQVARLRSAMLAAVSEDDIRAIVRQLVDKARTGDVRAAQEVLTRCLGKAEAIDLVDRLDALEEVLRGSRMPEERLPSRPL